MIRPTEARDDIFRVLMETYTNGGDTNWHGTTVAHENNRDLTTVILSSFVTTALADAKSDDGGYHQAGLFQGIVNVIWNTYSGGTTAESAARRIYEAFGFEVPA